MYEWCERNCKQGEFHFGSLIQIMYDELAQKYAEMKQVTAYALNVLKYCEQHPEKIGFYASANPDTITDAVVRGNVDHVGKLVADARRETVEQCAVTVWNHLATFEDCLEPTQRTNALNEAIKKIRALTPPDQTANPTN